MTDIERDIRAAILRALFAAKGAMPETALKQHLRNVFAHVAFADSDLMKHITATKSAGLICEADDAVVGTIWDLTLNGKTAAQRLQPKTK